VNSLFLGFATGWVCSIGSACLTIRQKRGEDLARRTIIIAVLLTTPWAALPIRLLGQDTPSTPQAAPESVTVVPGPRYQAGWLHGLMAGRGYRDLWNTPITVEVGDLSKLGGGLTPLRLGGGVTTRTLHVQGADGKRYVLRSVDKYVGQGIPEEFRGTPYEFVLQDQISAFHPSGALVVSALLQAVGVLHVESRLLVSPDDARLGEFREQFAGLLVLYEERPDEGPDDTEGFAGSRKIVGSERLFELLEEDPRHRVDAVAFLRARLIDLLVGDRDRSVNNWWWARFDDGDRYIWRPIPRDRDQAFIRLDGVLKWLLRFYEPRLVVFGEDYQVVGLTRSAWDLDRSFLVGLDKPSWDSIVTELQGQLTDSVIEASVQQMPAEHYQLIGATLANTLMKRRDRLGGAADRFYEIISGYADIHATDESELAVIDRIDRDHVEVRLYRRGDESRDLEQTPYFERTFNRDETHEIRLYLHGGADRAVVRGSAQQSIRVRIVGGGGADELIDSSRVRGRQTYFYDAGPRTQFGRGPSTVVVRRSAPRAVSWGETSALTPDWGHAWRPAPQLALDRDLGLFIAAGATHYRYGFLKTPYSSRIQLSGGYATSLERFVVDYRHDFRDAVRRVHPSLHARWSGIEILHFHGFGNATEAPESRVFYRVKQQQLLLAPSVTISGTHNFEIELGPVLKVSSTDTVSDARTFLSQERPYGSGSFGQLGAQAAFRLDRRDRSVASTRGFYLAGGASYYPALLEVDRGAFGGIQGEASAYLSPSRSANATLALRVAAKKMWGIIPFHEAAFIGGARTVRGFREQRYAGTAAVYANAELRVFLTKFSFLNFPTDFGVLGLTDVGRVFQDGATPGGWHTAIGGGIWIAPVQRSNTFSIAMARSVERTAFYASTGFLF